MLQTGIYQSFFRQLFIGFILVGWSSPGYTRCCFSGSQNTQNICASGDSDFSYSSDGKSGESAETPIAAPSPRNAPSALEGKEWIAASPTAPRNDGSKSIAARNDKNEEITSIQMVETTPPEPSHTPSSEVTGEEESPLTVLSSLSDEEMTELFSDASSTESVTSRSNEREDWIAASPTAPRNDGSGEVSSNEIMENPLHEQNLIEPNATSSLTDSHEEIEIIDTDIARTHAQTDLGWDYEESSFDLQEFPGDARAVLEEQFVNSQAQPIGFDDGEMSETSSVFSETDSEHADAMSGFEEDDLATACSLGHQSSDFSVDPAELDAILQTGHDIFAAGASSPETPEVNHQEGSPTIDSTSEQTSFETPDVSGGFDTSDAFSGESISDPIENGDSAVTSGGETGPVDTNPSPPESSPTESPSAESST